MEQTEGRALRWAGRGADRAAPWLLGVAVVVLSLSKFPDWFDPPVLLLAIVSGVTAGLARRTPWPLFTVAAVGWLTFAMWPAFVVASYYSATTLRRRLLGWYVAIALTGIAVPVVVTVNQGDDRYALSYVDAWALALWLVGLPAVLGLLVNARRQITAGALERAERVAAEQAARADQARAEERQRIAREMHDVVAHRVSLMVLHAGAIEVNAPDERTANEAALIRTTGREALADLREVLGVLRSGSADFGGEAPGPQPVLADLDRLLEQSRAAGLRVRRRDEGTPGPLPLTVERTAYRVVQEALTNIHKHAPEAETEVALDYRDDALHVEVRNAPTRVPAASLPDSGLGLLGLRERVALVGGELRVGPESGGGFAVRVRLPAGAAEPADSGTGPGA